MQAHDSKAKSYAKGGCAFAAAKSYSDEDEEQTVFLVQQPHDALIFLNCNVKFLITFTVTVARLPTAVLRLPTAFDLGEVGYLATRGVANQPITTNLRIQVVPKQKNYVNRILS